MKNKYNVYKFIVIVFTILTFLISLIVDKNKGYEYVCFIPLTYLIFFIFFKRIHKYSCNFKGIFLLNIFTFIKYVISIFLICILKNYDVPSYYAISISTTSYYYATILIIIEMITVFFTIEIFSDKIYNKKAVSTKIEKEYLNYRVGPIFSVFCVLSVLLIITNFSLFINKSLIIFSNNNSLTETLETSNFCAIIFNSFKLIVMGLLINKCIISYRQNKSKKNVFAAYLIISIYVFFSISTSRLNMILPFVLFIIITSEIFGKFGKKLNLIGLVLIIFLFFAVSIYKNPWKYNNNMNVFELVIEFTDGIQEYTSNIMPTAIGLQAIDYFGNYINVATLANDILGSVPIISHYINQNNRIYRLYNIYALKQNTMSQIIPMTVSSIGYFSTSFCWVLTFGNILLLMMFDIKQKIKHNSFLEEYISLYLLFIFVSCIFSNVQMLSGRFFVNYLPVAIIISLDKKIKIKKER